MSDTSSNNKRIAKNTIFLYMRMMLVMLVSLYTVRVVLSTLGDEDYGVFGAVGGVIASLSFATGVLANAAQRFFSVELGRGEVQRLKTTFGVFVILYLLFGLFTIILAETGGLWFLHHKMTIPLNRMIGAEWVFQCSVITYVMSVIVAPFNAMIIAKERMGIYASLGILDVVFKLLIVFVLGWIDGDRLRVYAVLLILVSLVNNLFCVVYSYRKFPETHVRLKWDRDIVKTVFGYSSWTLFGSLAYICNTQGINILLNVFFGPLLNAAYAIGNQVKGALNQFAGNFYAAMRPAMMKEFSKNNVEYVSGMFYTGTKIMFVLLFVLIFPVSLEIEGILELWLGKIGVHMVEFVRLMLLWGMVLSLSDPITTIIQAANKVKRYHLIVESITLLSLPVSYIVFHMGADPSSAFIVSILSLLLAHWVRLKILQPIINLSIWDYVKVIVFRICIIMGGSFLLWKGVSLLFPHFMELLIPAIIIEFVIAVFMCYFLILNSKERNFIKGIVESKLKH